VADRLRAIGYEPHIGVGGTGIIADLDGGRPGPTLLIRADMDALCATDPIARLTAAAATAGVTAIDPGILPVSDDFAQIAERVPAAFIAIGAAGPGCGGHHPPDFDIDEQAIGLTTEILTRAALNR